MDSLDALERNITDLLARYRAQQEQIGTLQADIERQREEMMRTHAELVELKTAYNRLQTAHALVADDVSEEERTRARQRITNIIAQINRAIAVLKQ